MNNQSNDIFSELRTKLEIAIKQRNVSQHEVSRQLNGRITNSTISRFLSGIGTIDAETAMMLGEWIGMTTEEIFGKNKALESSGTTLDSIKKIINEDKNIPNSLKEDFYDFFSFSYAVFMKNDLLREKKT